MGKEYKKIRKRKWRVDSNGKVISYYQKKQNHCGCGSNCYHYEYDGTDVYIVCNACFSDLFSVKPEYRQEYIDNNEWKYLET